MYLPLVKRMILLHHPLRLLPTLCLRYKPDTSVTSNVEQKLSREADVQLSKLG